MNVTITIDDKSVRDRLAKIARQMPGKIDDALFVVAQQGINVIQDRTAGGRGYKGPFEGYTASYASSKASGWARSSSRPGFGGDASGTVNLNVTGKMMSSMAARKGRGMAEIVFTRQTEARKAAFNNRKRPFFGLNSSEQKRLVKLFQRRAFQ